MLYKREIGHPFQVRLEKYKAITKSEVEKYVMIDHIWREKDTHYSLE